MGVTVTGLTAEKMLEYANAQIIDAEVIAGDLHFTTRGGSDINAGAVGGDPGPTGDAGPTSIVVCDDVGDRPTGGDRFEGLAIWQKDVNLFYIWDNANWILVPAGIPHANAEDVASVATGVTSGAYQDMGNPVEISFVKLRADTNLIVSYHGGIRNDNAFGEYVVGARVNGVDYDICIGFGDLGPKSGVIQIDSIPAGTYTIKLRKKRGNGAGTVYEAINSSCRNQLSVMETF